MNNTEIGRRIYESRIRSGLTQDQFGKRYDISGPAVFKFEKGKVRPSLGVWLKMGTDAGLSERHAVLIWAKARLPENYQEYLDVPTLLKEDEAPYGKNKKYSYAALKDPAKIKKLAKSDPTMPAALKQLLEDNELWALYKPTGKEIQGLKDTFTQFGFGSKDLYREALRLLREFARS